MDFDEKSILKYCEQLEKRVEQLEFRQTLMLSNNNINRLLLDYNIRQTEYKDIMDAMDDFRKNIENGKKVSHIDFESRVLDLLGRDNVDYHFCEYIAKAFMDDGRWDEVFPSLYGDMPKYKYLKEDKND